ncbi:MAG: hypothetical protein IPN01_30340 [Deltaproteobacteria bacterium]|nr:hypothetical protein [Deltaproteobacteria bacterium]
MSLPLLLALTLPNVAFAAEGDEACDDEWYVVESEEAYYLEGMGCVVGDISVYCEETFRGDCLSWDQATAIYEDSSSEVKDIYLLDCADGSDYAHRMNQSSSAWEAYLYFDEDGFAAGHFYRTFGDPWCCDGLETSRFYYGDPYATCIEPTDTGDTDTGDTPTQAAPTQATHPNPAPAAARPTQAPPPPCSPPSHSARRAGDANHEPPLAPRAHPPERRPSRVRC